MTLTEIGLTVVDWIYVAQGREHWHALDGNESYDSIKGEEFLDKWSFNFLKITLLYGLN